MPTGPQPQRPPPVTTGHEFSRGPSPSAFRPSQRVTTCPRGHSPSALRPSQRVTTAHRASAPAFPSAPHPTQRVTNARVGNLKLIQSADPSGVSRRVRCSSSKKTPSVVSPTGHLSCFLRLPVWPTVKLELRPRNGHCTSGAFTASPTVNLLVQSSPATFTAWPTVNLTDVETCADLCEFVTTLGGFRRRHIPRNIVPGSTSPTDRS